MCCHLHVKLVVNSIFKALDDLYSHQHCLQLTQMCEGHWATLITLSSHKKKQKHLV